MSEAIRIDARLSIPADEVGFHFSRSSGPGGQHVNRAQSRVELRFDVARSPSLSDAQRARLLAELKGQLDGDGVLHLFVQTHRSQFQNRQAALARFRALLAAALRPRKRRRPTRPSRAAKARRLAAKRRRGEQKRLRKRPKPEE